MAIIQAICSSFKRELMVGMHNFTVTTGNTFKLALYDSTANLSSATDVYTTTGEVTSSGTGYDAGGIDLTNVTPVLSGATAYVDFADVTWSGSSISARGALIYNFSATTPAKASVAVLDFGSDKVSSSGDFTVIFPAPDATNAIIRIA